MMVMVGWLIAVRTAVVRSSGELRVRARVFGSRKVCEKITVAHFNFIWQLLSNHKVISLKRFVSSFTTKLCN